MYSNGPVTSGANPKRAIPQCVQRAARANSQVKRAAIIKNGHLEANCHSLNVHCKKKVVDNRLVWHPDEYTRSYTCPAASGSGCNSVIVSGLGYIRWLRN